MRLFLFSVLLVGLLAGPGHISVWSTPAATDSLLVVGIEVSVGDKSPARLRVLSGQQASVATAESGAIGLTPIIRGDLIELAVVEIGDGDGGRPDIEVARVTLRLGDAITVETGLVRLRVQWTELLRRPEGSAASAPEEPCRVCCVYCDSQWHCACDVQTSCGHCCCPYACTCSSGDHRMKSDSAARAATNSFRCAAAGALGR